MNRREIFIERLACTRRSATRLRHKRKALDAAPADAWINVESLPNVFPAFGEVLRDFAKRAT